MKAISFFFNLVYCFIHRAPLRRMALERVDHAIFELKFGENLFNRINLARLN